MINRRQLFVLASGAVMFAGARGAFIISHRRNRLTDYAGGGRMKEIHGIEVA